VIARVLSIPPKLFERRTITFLSADEAEALIDAPDPARWEGRRDQALLTLALQAGLRVSELVGLNCGDLVLGTGAHERCEGKGRRHRSVPLTAPAQAVLSVWLDERAGRAQDPLFSTRTGRRLSRDAVERRLATHTANAAKRCPSLNGKRMHPHALRHSCAMSLLQAGVDTTVIALWLGHADVRSTQPYLHADLTIKERALALVTSADVKPGRYKPSDAVLAFLEGL
jgi:site-specific recombinase XerD